MIDISKIPIQILALDKRKELWQELTEDIKTRLNNNNVHPFVCGKGEILPREEYDQIDVTEPPMYWGYSAPGHIMNHYNAKLAHNSMIEKAIEKDWEYFILFEDDAYLVDRFERVWNGISPHIPEDWDLLYTGWWINDENDEWNLEQERAYNEDGEASIIKWGANLGGLHSVIIRNTMYKKILGMAHNDPIDSKLNRIPNINRYIIVPKIVHVKSVYSECEGSVIKRNEL